MPASNKPWVVTVTGNSTTYGYPTYFPDYTISQFQIGYACTVDSSAISWVLEYSLDNFDQSTVTSTGLTWFTSSGASAASTSATGFIGVPCTAIRPNVTSASSTGTLTIRILQSG